MPSQDLPTGLNLFPNAPSRAFPQQLVDGRSHGTYHEPWLEARARWH